MFKKTCANIHVFNKSHNYFRRYSGCVVLTALAVEIQKQLKKYRNTEPSGRELGVSQIQKRAATVDC